jgi:hypothetical protein
MFENSSSGKHKSIGKFYFNYGELKSGPTVEPSSAKGNIVLSNIGIQKKYSFLDYIFGGCEVGITVAVDFTASNGPPNQP